MSGYGFRKQASGPEGTPPDKLDLSGLARSPMTVDPVREADAIARGRDLGFVDRDERTTRRRRAPVPQGNVFIKGPQTTIDWFIDFTNSRGHRSYWEALEDLRRLAAGEGGQRPQ